MANITSAAWLLNNNNNEYYDKWIIMNTILIRENLHLETLYLDEYFLLLEWFKTKNYSTFNALIMVWTEAIKVEPSDLYCVLFGAVDLFANLDTSKGKEEEGREWKAKKEKEKSEKR